VLLAERIAIVSGGLSGIGAAITDRFAAEGATVVAADIAAETDALTAEAPGRFRYRLDVADPGAVARCVAAVLGAFGRIDALVNSAGVLAGHSFLETQVDVLDRVLAVNLRGTFLLSQAAARAMAAAGRGAIVTIASVSGQRGNAGRAAYGASKGGVITLTQVMATELAPRGVRVNALAPGPIATPMTAASHMQATQQRWLGLTPLGRYGTPAEVAAAALFLVSDEASFITGHVLNVDGGWQASGMQAEAAS
jgi:NAD(P)-dependent dehydrogenase (short-subunit alcohol dehydrogenase family)